MAILSLTRQDEIQEKIDKIPKITGGYNFPDVGLVDLAGLLGIEVVYADLTIDGRGYEGAIQYKDESDKSKGARVFINSESPSYRQRFTLAHEIGHFLLHEGAKNRVETTDYSSDNSIEETEANFFAASLLMPKKLILEAKENDLTIDEMIDKFMVSRSALINRLRWIASNER